MKNRIKINNFAFYLSAIFLIVLVIVAIFANFLAPYDPYAVYIENKLASPSGYHLLGTDSLGRDVISRIMYGARLSLSISIVITFLLLIIAFPVGLYCGFKEGHANEFFNWVANIVMAFPSFMLALSLVGVMGVGISNMIFAIVSVEWVYYAKILRNAVLSQKNLDYVKYAKIRGFSDFYILRKHILPFVYKPLLVNAFMNIGSIILMISSFSFLGIGVQPSVAEWGNMINDARPYFRNHPNLMLYPGLMIMFTVSALNVVAHHIERRVIK